LRSRTPGPPPFSSINSTPGGFQDWPRLSIDVPAVSGKKRCRMHGGAPGSGAPKQNQNALKHGLFTQQAIEEREHVQALLRQSRKLLQDIE
jgi:hypothetical protein